MPEQTVHLALLALFAFIIARLLRRRRGNDYLWVMRWDRGRGFRFRKGHRDDLSQGDEW